MYDCAADTPWLANNLDPRPGAKIWNRKMRWSVLYVQSSVHNKITLTAILYRSTDGRVARRLKNLWSRAAKNDMPGWLPKRSVMKSSEQLKAWLRGDNDTMCTDVSVTVPCSKRVRCNSCYCKWWRLGQWESAWCGRDRQVICTQGEKRSSGKCTFRKPTYRWFHLTLNEW